MELLFQGQLVLADAGHPYWGTSFSSPVALWCLRSPGGSDAAVLF